MNEIVINQTALRVKEHNGKRVVTFKDIDAVHERPEGTARKRFNDNKKYFIEGEDYFVRKTDEAKTEFNIIAPNGLVLITESGYYMLVKSFTDELSWQVQRELTNSYFRVQQIQADYSTLSPQLQFLIQMEQRQNALEKKQEELEKKLEFNKTEVIKAAFEYGRIGILQREEIQKAVKKRAIEICQYAETYDKVGKSVISSIYKALQKHFEISSYLDLAYNQYTDAMIFVQYFEPDQKLYLKVFHERPKPDISLLNAFGKIFSNQESETENES